MNWREIDWNIVDLARVIGVAIIALGILLSALDASALNTGSLTTAFGSHYKIRYFLHEMLGYLWQGGLVIVVAEIANRVWWGREEEPDQEGDAVASPAEQ